MNEHEIGAVALLALNRVKFPELSAAESRAKADLADAIVKMDMAEDIPGRHDLQEQVEVNRLLIEYGNALAALLRGE